MVLYETYQDKADLLLKYKALKYFTENRRKSEKVCQRTCFKLKYRLHIVGELFKKILSTQSALKPSFKWRQSYRRWVCEQLMLRCDGKLSFLNKILFLDAALPILNLKKDCFPIQKRHLHIHSSLYTERMEYPFWKFVDGTRKLQGIEWLKSQCGFLYRFILNE